MPLVAHAASTAHPEPRGRRHSRIQNEAKIQANARERWRRHHTSSTTSMLALLPAELLVSILKASTPQACALLSATCHWWLHEISRNEDVWTAHWTARLNGSNWLADLPAVSDMLQYRSLANLPLGMLTHKYTAVPGFRNVLVFERKRELRIRSTCRFTQECPGCSYVPEPLPHDRPSCWVCADIAPGHGGALGLGVIGWRDEGRPYDCDQDAPTTAVHKMCGARSLPTSVVWYSNGAAFVMGKELRGHDGWGESEGKGPRVWREGVAKVTGQKFQHDQQRLDTVAILYDPVAGAVTMSVRRLRRSFSVQDPSLRGGGPMRWHVLVLLGHEASGCTLRGLSDDDCEESEEEENEEAEEGEDD